MIELKFKKPGMKKLLIFDLDETLIHCLRTKTPQRTPDVYLNIPLANGTSQKYPFNVRPYTKQILTLANKYFEVAVFTASTSVYADTAINYIDPNGEYIQHRFYRESCVKEAGGIYVKDLRIFKNVSLKDMLLVDNAVYSFGEQIDNGIPIKSFMEDKNDTEFVYLMRFLE